MSNDGGPLPTTEEKAQYEAAKKELMQALNRKRQADKQLAQVELQIYNLEASYLTETAAHSGGNIITGYDNYLKNQGMGRRKYEVADSDRMFSSSSATYLKSLDLLGEGEESSATVDEYKPGTVIVPPVLKTQESAAARAKKDRDREYQRAKRAARKRSGGAFSDDESVTSSGRRPNKRARTTMEDD